MSDLAIDAHALTKHYGSVRALEELDLQIHTGEIFGFLGPNGSGKSTTIRTLLDQIRPTAGRADVLGMDSHRQSLQIRQHIGYVPGDLALYPKMTGAQTLDYFAKLRGNVDRSFIAELAERLTADLSRRVGDYSTGNRQKIGLIQAFMHRPQLLILDEPNAGLDPLMQQEFHTLLREARAAGQTVFLSSHTLSEVERVADRVGIIRVGRLVAVERIDDLKAKAIRRLELEFAEPVPAGLFDGVNGVRQANIDGQHASVSFDGSINPLLRAAMGHELVDLHTRDADLEEIFLAYYRGTTNTPATQGAAATSSNQTATGSSHVS